MSLQPPVPTAQLATRIPFALHRALKLRAAETGESQSTILVRALERELGVTSTTAKSASSVKRSKRAKAKTAKTDKATKSAA